MRATGFSGFATIMGKERKVVFDDGHFTIEPLAMEEAQLLVETLERNSNAMTRASAAVTLAGTQSGRTPASAPNSPRVTDPNPTGRVPIPAGGPAKAKPEVEPEHEPEPPPPSDDELEREAAEEREAIQAEAREADEREAKRKAEEDKKRKAEEKAAAEKSDKAAADKKAADEKAAIEAKKAKARKEAEEKAAAEKAASERGNKQAATSGAIDHDETKEDTRPAPKATNGKASIPTEIRSAKHLRAVLVYCSEELHFKKPEEFVQWCSDHAAEIEVVQRIGDRLKERVERALEVMSSN